MGKSKPVGESVSLFPLLYLKKKKKGGNQIIAMSSLHRIMILEGRGREGEQKSQDILGF